MARVHRLRAPSTAAGASRHSRVLEKKTKAPYKVVFEQVTEKKRKLVTVLSLSQKAPPGYTFIPAGDPQITSRCKELAREDGLRVYIVSDSKHRHNTNLSHEVHRIGYHFPSLVVEKACMSLGVSLSQSGQVLTSDGKFSSMQQRLPPTKKKRTRRVRTTVAPKDDISQATLDTQAREAIRDLFPKIPEKDLHDIICRAFQKGKDRVGTAAELTLPRRVQLAVVAHIRHIYTNYDTLLKVGSWQDAREQVEKACLDQLVQWRNDDDDDPNAMEEILREVIILDDDEEDQDQDNCKIAPTNQNHRLRSDSVETIPRYTSLEDQMQSLNCNLSGRVASEDGELRSNFQPTYDSNQSHVQRFQNISSQLDRISVHHRRWQEALQRRRMNQVSVLTANKDSMLHHEETRFNSRPALHLQGRESASHWLGSIDHRGHLQSQRISRSRIVPIFRDDSIADEAMDTRSGPLHEDSSNSGQVSIPFQHRSHFFGHNQNNLTVSNQQKDNYHSFHSYPYIKPDTVPIEEHRNPVTVLSSPQGLQAGVHDPRVGYLSRERERIFPSVEGKPRDVNHRHRPPFVIIEQTPKHTYDPTAFTHPGEHAPQTIKLDDDNMESYVAKHDRPNDVVLLSPVATRQTHSDSYRERARIISQKPKDGCYSSSQNRIEATSEPSFSPFAGDERSMVLYPMDTQSYPERQRLGLISRTRVDAIQHQPRLNDYDLGEPAHHEHFQVPFAPASSKKQRQIFLNPTHGSVDFSQSFPYSHASENKYPTLPGSRPYGLVNDNSVQNFRQDVNSSGIDVYNLSALSSTEQVNLADLATGTEYYKQHSQVHQGGLNGAQNAYGPPPEGWVDIQAYDRPRTGILLRGISNSRHLIPDGAGSHLSEPRSRMISKEQPNRQMPVSGYQNVHNKHIQTPVEEMFRRDHLRPHSWANNVQRIQLGPGVGRDSHDPNGALPFLSTEHGNARKVTDNLANHNSNNRDRKAHQEIIVID